MFLPFSYFRMFLFLSIYPATCEQIPYESFRYRKTIMMHSLDGDSILIQTQHIFTTWQESSGEQRFLLPRFLSFPMHSSSPISTSPQISSIQRILVKNPEFIFLQNKFLRFTHRHHTSKNPSSFPVCVPLQANEEQGIFPHQSI